MASEDTKIQVISTVDYTDQHLIPIPSPSAALAPSSVRVRPSLLSLIGNTLSCASHPEVKIGWWDVHPLPSNTPVPFNDPEKYGRIGVWGWARVLESTIDLVAVGDRIYGFFPIATLPVDLQLRRTDAPGIYREISSYRATAMRMYNTYEVYTAEAVTDETSQALDALAKPTFRLGYLLDRYTFNPKTCVHPSNPADGWTPTDADLTDSIVVLVSGTSKTALSLAYMLAQREQAAKPARVVALTSAESAPFAAATGWYSDVFKYSEAEEVTHLVTNGRKVVIVEFGGREDSAARVHTAVKDGAGAVQFLVVGAETKRGAAKVTAEVVATREQQVIVRVNVGAIIESAETVLGDGGEGRLNADYNKIWGDFKKHGFPGMKIAWGNGVEEYAQAYENMCNGEMWEADTGLVFKI